MSGSSRSAGLLGALVLAVICTTVHAQPTNRDQEMVRRLRQQIQQLQAQQASTQAALQAELQQARDAAAAQKAQAQDVQAELRRTKLSSAEQRQLADAAQQELQAERTALQQRHDQLLVRQRDTEAALAKTRGDGNTLQTSLQRREQQLADLADRHVLQAQGLKQCIDNNLALQTLGRELLQRYADKGLGESLATIEPFLQTRRVALENLVQGYEDKLDALALRRAAASGAGGGAP